MTTKRSDVQSETRPTLHLVGPRVGGPTAEDVATLVEAVTDERPTEEAIEQVRVAFGVAETQRPAPTVMDAVPLPPITWVDVDTLNHCGHGVQFRHLRFGRNVAFIVGFGWLHRPADPVTVQLRKLPVSDAIAPWSAIVNEARAAVEAFLTHGRKHGFQHGNFGVEING